MWDWKQLRWMKLFGWDVNDMEKGKLRMFKKLQGFILFWVIPIGEIGQVVFLYMLFKNGDLKGTMAAISELVTAFLAVIKSFKFAYRGAEIKSIIEDIEDLDKHRMKYFKNDKYSDLIMESHTKACKKYLYLALASFLAGCHWVLPSFISAFSGKYIPLAHDWVPWNDKTFVGWLFHSIYFAMFMVSCVSGLLAYESLVLSFNEMTIALLKSISYGFSSLKFENGNVREDLYELHLMHLKALNITKKVKSFTNFIIQADCLLFAFSMCTAVLEMTRAWSTPIRKINLAEMLLVCGSFFYLQSHKCQSLMIEFANVATAALNNDWYNGTTEDKRKLSIIVHMCRVPVKFGSIIQIDLSTFIAVMKTSFSYYNALMAFDI